MGGGGGVGPHDVRRDPDAGTSGDGKDVRLELSTMAVGLIGETTEGLDGKSCESRLDPDLFLRKSGGRDWHCPLTRSVAGDPI